MKLTIPQATKHKGFQQLKVLYKLRCILGLGGYPIIFFLDLELKCSEKLESIKEQ